MKPHSDKQKIKAAIRKYLNAIKPGTNFFGITLIRYCIERINRKDVFGDTVLRYLREMRSDGIIDYEPIGQKSKSEYKLLKI